MTSNQPQNPETVRKLTFDIACALVDDEDNVVVKIEEVGSSHVISVEVASADLGKMIGQGGRTARSIRTLLGGSSMKQGLRFVLDIRG